MRTTATLHSTIARLRRYSGRILFAALILVYVLPLYVVLVNAFKPYESIVIAPLSVPLAPTIENFRRAIRESEILTLYVNSTVITVGSLLLLTTVASMLSYVFCRSKQRGVRILYRAIVASMMIPVQSILIASLKTLQVLGLFGTLPGLILFYGGTYLSIAVFMYTEFMRTIPVSLEESARIDGASPFQIFFQIILPLLKSCTATVVIFLGMWIWNDFLPPMYILGSTRGRTITTGIYSAIGLHTTDWSLVFATVFLASLPVVALYLALQKQFQSGLIAGAVK